MDTFNVYYYTRYTKPFWNYFINRITRLDYHGYVG